MSFVAYVMFLMSLASFWEVLVAIVIVLSQSKICNTSFKLQKLLLWPQQHHSNYKNYESLYFLGKQRPVIMRVSVISCPFHLIFLELYFNDFSNIQKVKGTRDGGNNEDGLLKKG